MTRFGRVVNHGCIAQSYIVGIKWFSIGRVPWRYARRTLFFVLPFSVLPN